MLLAAVAVYLFVAKGLTMRRRSSGFTLIELLVVVAIIALLIAILLPSLARAKAQAVRVKCGAQEKQWGMVVTMYAHENYDWFGLQWGEAVVNPATGSADKHTWSGIGLGRINAVSGDNLYDSEWNTYINQGTKTSQEMRTCPGDPLFGQVAAAGANSGAVLLTRPPVDYAMVRYFPITPNVTMWRMPQATHPNSTMLMCDSPTIQYGTSVAPVGNGTMYSYYACSTVGAPPQVTPVQDLDSEPGETLTQALAKRHLGIGNVLFLDAHVEQHPYSDYVKNIPTKTTTGPGSTTIPFPTELGKIWTNITL